MRRVIRTHTPESEWFLPRTMSIKNSLGQYSRKSYSRTERQEHGEGDVLVRTVNTKNKLE